MRVTFDMRVDELDESVIKAIKLLFQEGEINIIVREHDETEYLLRSEANRKHLLRAVDYIENGGELIEVDLEDLQ